MNSKYRILVVALTYVILCTVMGAVMNAINVQLSPTFFRLVFHWQHVVRIQSAAIGLGGLIGLGCGLFFALVFMGIVGIVTRGDFRLERALRFIVAYSLLAPAGYVCGGLLGIGAGALIPAFFQGPFLPSELSGSTETIKFAGVLWATWGTMGGEFFGMILAAIAFLDYSRNKPRRGIRAVLVAGFSAVMKHLKRRARAREQSVWIGVYGDGNRVSRLHRFTQRINPSGQRSR